MRHLLTRVDQAKCWTNHSIKQDRRVWITHVILSNALFRVGLKNMEARHACLCLSRDHPNAGTFRGFAGPPTLNIASRGFVRSERVAPLSCRSLLGNKPTPVHELALSLLAENPDVGYEELVPRANAMELGLPRLLCNVVQISQRWQAIRQQARRQSLGATQRHKPATTALWREVDDDDSNIPRSCCIMEPASFISVYSKIQRYTLISEGDRVRTRLDRWKCRPACNDERDGVRQVVADVERNRSNLASRGEFDGKVPTTATTTSHFTSEVGAQANTVSPSSLATSNFYNELLGTQLEADSRRLNRVLRLCVPDKRAGNLRLGAARRDYWRINELYPVEKLTAPHCSCNTKTVSKHHISHQTPSARLT